MHETSAPVIAGTRLSVGDRCNLACSFCAREGRGKTAAPDELREALRLARERGRDRVVFWGGEPLAEPRLAELLAAARREGLKLGLSTGARALSDPELTGKLARFGLDCVSVWLCGPDSALHDGLVGVPGAFARALRAIGNLASLPGLKLELRYPLLAANAGRAEEFVELVGRLKAREGVYACVAYPDPALISGGGSGALEPREAARIIRRALERGAKLGVPAYYEGLPRCLFKDFPGRSLDRYRDDDAAAGDAGAPGGCVNGPGPGGEKKLLACAECVDASSCRGLYRTLVDEFGFTGVVPTRGVQSNSFDYVYEADVEGFRPRSEGCDGWRLPARGGVGRSVMLLRDGAVRRYRADTINFSEEELRRIKQSAQQLYLDVSEKAALDDFQKDVRQARVAAECLQCPERARCALVYELSDEVPFHREERWLRGELGRMRGRVLDLGCGDLRYQDIVSGLVRAGQAEYHGLDPDGEALAKLRKADFPVRIFNQGVEEFACADGHYDYVLMLRSINHFADLKRTFDVVTRALRNHGQLIVADSIPLALLRSREKTAAARASLAPRFEHYRNYASQQVIEFLRAGGYPLVVNIHRPVMAKTSNLWLLKLIKIDPEREDHGDD